MKASIGIIAILLAILSFVARAQNINVSVECPNEISALDLLGFVVRVTNTSSEDIFIVGSSDNVNVTYIIENGSTMRTSYEPIRDTANLFHINRLKPGQSHSFGVITNEPVSNGFGDCGAEITPHQVSAKLIIDYYFAGDWCSKPCFFEFLVRRQTPDEQYICNRLHELVKSNISERDFSTEMESLLKMKCGIINRFYGPYVAIGMLLERRRGKGFSEQYEKRWIAMSRKYGTKAMWLVIREQSAWRKFIYRERIYSFGSDE